MQNLRCSAPCSGKLSVLPWCTLKTRELLTGCGGEKAGLGGNVERAEECRSGRRESWGYCWRWCHPASSSWISKTRSRGWTPFSWRGWSKRYTDDTVVAGSDFTQKAIVGSPSTEAEGNLPSVEERGVGKGKEQMKQWRLGWSKFRNGGWFFPCEEERHPKDTEEEQ